MEGVPSAADDSYVPVSSICSLKWSKIGAEGVLDVLGGVAGDEEKARAAMIQM
jgi:hypothetical protein